MRWSSRSNRKGWRFWRRRRCSRLLGIGELARLGFGSTLPPGAQRVGIEGDWLDRFARLLGPRGRWMRRVVSVDTKAPGDPERALSHELVLDNATFRLQDVAAAWTRYLVMDFRASAVSDDKRDVIVRLGINLATGSLPDAVVTALGATPDHVPFDDGRWRAAICAAGWPAGAVGSCPAGSVGETGSAATAAGGTEPVH